MKKGGTRDANIERLTQLIVLFLVPITTRELDKSLPSPFTSGKSSCLHGLTVSGVWVFLKRLREARQAAGLTQVKVAAKLGRPQSFVSKCESGERRVDVVELRKLAKLYKKDLTFFVQ